MNIVLMESGRGNHRGVIDGWRDKLGLTDADRVTLLSWFPPAEPLPVAEHLVFGPQLRPGRAPRRSETAGDLFGDADIPSGEMSDEANPRAGLGRADASSAFSEADLIEQLPESAAGAARPSTASLPLTDPRRLKAAAAWRARRAKRTATSARRRVTTRIRSGNSRPARVLRRVLGLHSDSIGNRYALSVVASPVAVEAFRRADVVLPMDGRTQRAAWLLARRHDRPAVVVGFQTGARVIAERRG